MRGVTGVNPAWLVEMAPQYYDMETFPNCEGKRVLERLVKQREREKVMKCEKGLESEKKSKGNSNDDSYDHSSDSGEKSSRKNNDKYSPKNNGKSGKKHRVVIIILNHLI